MRWKIFQWLKFLFRYSSNSRKLSRQKFHNELAWVFTAHYASKNADWNQQQLMDGGILENRNSANHPYCFLSNQKKIPDSGFLACDLWKDYIMPSSVSRKQITEIKWEGMFAGLDIFKPGQRTQRVPPRENELDHSLLVPLNFNLPITGQVDSNKGVWLY